MDKATLVTTIDRDIRARIMEALTRAKIPFTFCDWYFVDQLEEWQLLIATPWNDKRGPHATYSRIIEAFQKANIYEHVPMRRVVVRSPDDPTVKELEKENEGFLSVLRH